MSFRNSVTIVASPRPRVGKTLLARLLTDFHLQEGPPGRGLRPQCRRRHAGAVPARARTAPAIDDIKGQMALFDRLIADDGVTKVVDLGHESFEAFFALAEQIGFAEEAHRRGIAPAILFVITPDATLGREPIAACAARFPRPRWCRCTTRFSAPPSTATNIRSAGGALLLHICRCWRRACAKYIERRPFSFVDRRHGVRDGASRETPCRVAAMAAPGLSSSSARSNCGCC